jgi:AraC-like DNA-binding protein
MSEQFPFTVSLKSEKQYTRPSHSHDYLQLCYISSGSCYHWVQERRWDLHAGDLFAIPPFTAHQLESRPRLPFRMVQLDFAAEFVQPQSLELLPNKREPMPRIRLSDPQRESVSGLIEAIMTEWRNKETGYELVIRAELLKLLVLLARQSERQQARDPGISRTASHHDAISRAVRFIERHFAEPLRLEEAASVSFLSPDYFGSLLKQLTGKTFVETLTAVRIRHARRLLATTDLKVIEVCFLSGFQNVGHFNEVFKRTTGASPKQYRLSYRELN